MTKTIVPVILCGGSGTRLWPASRENHPKQFLSLMDDFSLLQNTMRRALRISGADAGNIVTVTLGALSGQVAKQLSEIDPKAADHILSEPSARNTAAAVAYAAAYVESAFGRDSVMWILPADHHIGNEDVLAASFRHAMLAAEQGNLVTFGICPTRPDTGYGYINVGGTMLNDSIFRAESFVEKPDLKTAQAYLESGKYLWNSGMFLFETGTVLDHYRDHATDILDGVNEAMQSGVVDADRYAAIASQPFDKAIMEKSSVVAVVPCDPEWSDIGSWESLWDIRKKDMHGNVVEGRAACFATTNSLIQAQDRLIACAGLKDIIVVETGDAILIADRSNGDAMRGLVKGLKISGAREVVDPPSAVAQPWSMVATLPGTDYTAREIVIQPGEMLRLDAHDAGTRFLTVVEGQGRAVMGKDARNVSCHETMFISAGIECGLHNDGAETLKIIEVAEGTTGILRIENRSRTQEAA